MGLYQGGLISGIRLLFISRWVGLISGGGFISERGGGIFQPAFYCIWPKHKSPFFTIIVFSLA